MSRWHPWRHMREHYPHVQVNTRCALPGGVEGEWHEECGIRLHWELTQLGRRCALTHEIIHMERGWAPRSLEEARLEEAIVVELTARRLIPLADLVDAIRWCPDAPDHRDLNVVPSVLTVRVRVLLQWERDVIRDAVEGRAA